MAPLPAPLRSLALLNTARPPADMDLTWPGPLLPPLQTGAASVALRSALDAASAAVLARSHSGLDMQQQHAALQRLSSGCASIDVLLDGLKPGEACSSATAAHYLCLLPQPALDPRGAGAGAAAPTQLAACDINWCYAWAGDRGVWRACKRQDAALLRRLRGGSALRQARRPRRAAVGKPHPEAAVGSSRSSSQELLTARLQGGISAKLAISALLARNTQSHSCAAQLLQRCLC